MKSISNHFSEIVVFALPLDLIIRAEKIHFLARHCAKNLIYFHTIEPRVLIGRCVSEDNKFQWLSLRTDIPFQLETLGLGYFEVCPRLVLKWNKIFKMRKLPKFTDYVITVGLMHRTQSFVLDQSVAEKLALATLGNFLVHSSSKTVILADQWEDWLQSIFDIQSKGFHLDYTQVLREHGRLIADALTGHPQVIEINHPGRFHWISAKIIAIK